MKPAIPAAKPSGKSTKNKGHRRKPTAARGEAQVVAEAPAPAKPAAKAPAPARDAPVRSAKPRPAKPRRPSEPRREEKPRPSEAGRPLEPRRDDKAATKPPRGVARALVVRPQAGAELDPQLLDAWRKALIQLGRLKRRAGRTSSDQPERMAELVKATAQNVVELWQIYTQERGELSRGLMSGMREAFAYLLGFHLPNAARTQLLLSRATQRHNLAPYFTSQPRLTWHDLGSGTGAIAHAAATFLLGLGVAKENLHLNLYDGVGALLDAGRAVFAAQGLEDRIKTHRLGLEALDLARFSKIEAGLNVVSMGYVWNELAKNPVARSHLLTLFQRLKNTEALVAILEPATQGHCRETMALRDSLTAMGYVPLYPCPRQAACPMLELSRDWCFSEGEWARPPEIVALDERIGIDRKNISGTVMLFASPSAAEALHFKAMVQPVVVGRPVRVEPRARSRSAKMPGPKPVSQVFDYLLCDGKALKKQAPQPGKIFLRRGELVTV